MSPGSAPSTAYGNDHFGSEGSGSGRLSPHHLRNRRVVDQAEHVVVEALLRTVAEIGDLNLALRQVRAQDAVRTNGSAAGFKPLRSLAALRFGVSSPGLSKARPGTIAPCPSQPRPSALIRSRSMSAFRTGSPGRTVRIGIKGVVRVGPHRELCRTGPEASFHPSDRRAS